MYDNFTRSIINHCIKELSYPKASALYVSAEVMLLENSIVKESLMNGSVGTVIEIVYNHPRGKITPGVY